jgi:hypothetical protein
VVETILQVFRIFKQVGKEVLVKPLFLNIGARIKEKEKGE